MVGAVVVWTPGNRSMIKELGLDKPINVHSQEALLDRIAKKYGKQLPAGARRPGVQESKDPKKDP